MVESKSQGELIFIGLMASKVGAAGRQQRITYEDNNNTYIIRVYRCSMIIGGLDIYAASSSSLPLLSSSLLWIFWV